MSAYQNGRGPRVRGRPMDGLNCHSLNILAVLLRARRTHNTRTLASILGINYSAVYLHLLRLRRLGLVAFEGRLDGRRQVGTLRPTCVFIPANQLGERK